MVLSNVVNGSKVRVVMNNDLEPEIGETVTLVLSDKDKLWSHSAK